MDPQHVATYAFLILTGAFAAMLLWRISPIQPHSEEVGVRSVTPPVRGLVPTSAGEDAAKVIEALGETVEKMLASSASFGKVMNTIGPTAIAAVFTAFFGFLAAITALIHLQ